MSRLLCTVPVKEEEVRGIVSVQKAGTLLTTAPPHRFNPNPEKIAFFENILFKQKQEIAN